MWGVWGLCVSWQFLLGGPFIRTSEPHPIPPFDIAPSDVHERHNPGLYGTTSLTLGAGK